MKPNYQYKDKELANKRKQERLKKRIKDLLNQDAYFLTFTFNEKTLEKTTAQTRLRYIKQYLNEQAKEYILNCDYGTKNEREHYHALIKPKGATLILSNYKYGWLDAKKLFTYKRYSVKDKNLVADFLKMHATKWTTAESRIIYSRKQPKHYRFKYKKQADLILARYKQTDKAKEHLNEIKQWRIDHNLKP